MLYHFDWQYGAKRLPMQEQSAGGSGTGEKQALLALDSSLRPVLDPSLLSACIHCGLCLPACPTYLATGREMESPRGRIQLLTLFQKGELAATPRLVEHIDSCLGCLGCQSACPSGVKYGKILDQARPILAGQKKKRWRALLRLASAKILPDYKKLHLLGKLLRLWQASPLKRLFSPLPVSGKWAARLTEWQDLLPPVPRHLSLPRQSWMVGEKKGPLQLFSGCVMDVFYNHVNHAAIRLLTAQRRIVQVPEQTCCGALAFHAGENDIAIDLAKRNIEFFEGTQGEIVVTAAGCGAMLKGYGELLAHDDHWRERAAGFAARVADLSESLSGHDFVGKPKALGKKVAYHAACHLAHAQNIHDLPISLLSVLPGIELIPLGEFEHCCGSAGIFNLTHTELSMKILERKMAYLKDTGADCVVTSNPGCLLQLEKGIRQLGLPMAAVHLAELLDEAWCQGDAGQEPGD